jgi:ubiquitin carboxyl-terminal hydrolase L3
VSGAADADRQAAAGHEAVSGSQPYYMKQTIGNACGTIAMLHAVGNNKERAGIGEGDSLQQTQPYLGGGYITSGYFHR